MYKPDFPPVPYRLGLYPVVDSVEWIERLLKAGVIPTPQRNGGNHIGFHLLIAFILDAQLEGANACLQQSLYPRHAVHHRIEP